MKSQGRAKRDYGYLDQQIAVTPRGTQSVFVRRSLNVFARSKKSPKGECNAVPKSVYSTITFCEAEFSMALLS